MEGKEWILTNRTDTFLYVRLYKKRIKRKGHVTEAKRWEAVESLDEATGFDSESAADREAREHRVPYSYSRARQYATARTEELSRPQPELKRVSKWG